MGEQYYYAAVEDLASQSSARRSGAALQGRQQDMAEEQWKFQKKMYQDRLLAAQAGGDSMSALVNQYNTAYGDARAANENRYNEMLGIADRNTGQRQADIRQDYMGQQSDMMNQLARLGMSNTTIGANLGTGVQREMQQSLNRSADQAQQTKLGIMERRTDAYPSNEVILALAQQMGAMGGRPMSALGDMTLGGPAPQPQA